MKKGRNNNSQDHPSSILPSRGDVAPGHRERQWGESPLKVKLHRWIESIFKMLENFIQKLSSKKGATNTTSQQLNGCTYEAQS